MSDNQIILEAFNDMFVDFIKDIQRVFPDEEDIHTAKNYVLGLKRLDPKMLIILWKHHIVGKYGDHIASGNIDFFIEKDYVEDLKHLGKSAEKVIRSIDGMKSKIKQMGDDNMDISIQYIQNLTTLSNAYKG